MAINDADDGSSRSSLAALLRAWRDRALLTQEQLALRAGLGVRTIRRLESDSDYRPRTDSVRLLARALGLGDAESARLVATARNGSVPPLPPAQTQVPRQLPADIAGFAGRPRQLQELDSVLGGEGAPTAVVISAIAGTAGVGKTALAVHWAHRAAGHFPDGQLYVNLRGFHPGGTPTGPAMALRGFLTALDVPAQRIPAGLDAQAALYRSLLADRRMLIVLDNARDADQVRPLLPGSPRCLTLLTSRNHLTSLIAREGARSLLLDLMSRAESRQLLVGRIGTDRATAETGAIEQIITYCARLPLALAIAAARAVIQPHLRLSTLAAELREVRHRLGALADGDPASDVRSVFSWSYRALTPAAARLFRLLGSAPGPDLSAAAAASLAGLSLTQVRPLLAELARAHLIDEHAPGRYTFHDLLRAYAAERAHQVDADHDRDAATGRVLDHYLHSAGTAARLLDPHRDPMTLTAHRPGVTPEIAADYGQAIGWFITEHQVMLAAVEYATGAGLDTHAWQLAWTLATYFDTRGFWHDWATVGHTAVTSAERSGSPLGQRHAHRNLALAHIRLGLLDDAQPHLLRALELHRRAGDVVGQAHIHVSLANVCERLERLAEALDHIQHALKLYRSSGHRRGEANTLSNLGWLHSLRGDHAQAVNYCRQALVLCREIGDRIGQAAACDSLGYAHHHLGDHDLAVSCYEDALVLFRELGDRYNEADTLTRLGETRISMGGVDAARTAWQQALSILVDLGHPGAGKLRTKIDSIETGS
jgi:tetratricopeptide (TPR) repeat protein/transcriptional regulator with XRE-family HTH domain